MCANRHSSRVHVSSQAQVRQLAGVTHGWQRWEGASTTGLHVTSSVRIVPYPHTIPLCPGRLFEQAEAARQKDLARPVAGRSLPEQLARFGKITPSIGH